MTGIILAILVVGATGLLIGFFLTLSAKKFYVEVDEREEAIAEVLPGNNCGGCGFAGCSSLAKAIANGEAPVSQCPVGGEAVALEISKIMGVEASVSDKKVAFVHCNGNCENASNLYEYSGARDCSTIKSTPGGGPKACNYGCLGGGSCTKVCAFDAIHIVDGIAKVDRENCKACGKCVDVCPNHLISLIPYSAKTEVACSSKDIGKVVMKACKSGCIACHLCEKNCPSGAISVIDNVAVIDHDKCDGCGICTEKCPKKVIVLV